MNLRSSQSILIQFFSKLLFLLSFSILQGCIAQNNQSKCKETVDVMKMALQSHVLYKALTTELMDHTIERYQSLMQNYRWFLTDSEVLEIKRLTSTARADYINQSLENENCSFFDYQASIVSNAFYEFVAAVPSVDVLMVELLSRESTPQSESTFDALDSTKLNVSLKNVRDLRSNILDILSLQVDHWSKVVDRTQAVRFVSIRFLKRLNKLSEVIENFNKEHFLRSFFMALDPHSEFAEVNKSNLLSDFSESLVGIGVVFSEHPYGVQVEELPKNGPAYVTGQIKKGDIVFAIDQNSLEGIDVSDISKFSLGKEGTDVVLSIGNIENGILVNQREVKVKRGKIERGSFNIKSSRVIHNNNSILIIHLDYFFEGSALQVAKEVLEQSKSGSIDAIILDLRNNPGGIYDEAVRLVSYFITSGPVSVLKGSSGEFVSRDTDSRRIYDGPLFVAVNNGSASASELVAGALKDYKRAIIVGSPQTYGKGTSQSMFSFQAPHGSHISQIKLTSDYYFTAGGNSPQITGVQSDIVVPGVLIDENQMEKAQKYALPHLVLNEPLLDKNAIEENKLHHIENILPILKAASQRRVEANSVFLSQDALKFLSGDLNSAELDVQMKEIENIVSDYILEAQKY